MQRRGPYRQLKSKVGLMREVFGPGKKHFAIHFVAYVKITVFSSLPCSGHVLLWFLPCHNLPSRKDYVHIPTYQRMDV